jgi:hypothetical protein
MAAIAAMHDARLVVGVHDRHQLRIAAQRTTQRLRIDETAGLRFEPADLPTAFLQVFTRIEHRFVLGA